MKCSVFIFYIKDILISPVAGKESAVTILTCIILSQTLCVSRLCGQPGAFRAVAAMKESLERKLKIQHQAEIAKEKAKGPAREWSGHI